MIRKRLLLFFIALLPMAITSCHDDDDDLIGLWTRFGEFDGSPRYAASSFTLGNKGYVIGGLAGNSSVKDAWVYDMNLKRWDQILSEFPGIPRHNAVAVGCDYNSKAYYGLGYSTTYRDNQTLDGIDLNETDGRLWDWWEFDPATNQWTRLPDFTETGAAARYDAIAFCIQDQVYVGLGSEKDRGVVAEIYPYDVKTNKWGTHIGYQGGKRTGASVFVIDDIAYLFAGEANGEYAYRFHSFDPSQPEGSQWNELREIRNSSDEDYDDDYAIMRRDASTFVIDGYGFVTCGSYSGSLRNDTWKYDPATDLWEKVAKFKGSSRDLAVSFSTGYKEGAFILTGKSGSSSSGYFDDMWNFNPYVYDDDDY